MLPPKTPSPDQTSAKMPGPPFRTKRGASVDLEAVVIHTERLTLRPITRHYADDVFREFTPEIAKFLIAQPTGDFADTLGYIERAEEGRAKGHDLAVAVLAKDSGEFLGAGGLHSRAIFDEPTLGIWLKRGAHGRAYGREAVAGLCGWARGHLDYAGLLYDVDRANAPSRRIAESLGGVIIGEAPTPRGSIAPLDGLIYRIPLDL